MCSYQIQFKFRQQPCYTEQPCHNLALDVAPEDNTLKRFWLFLYLCFLLLVVFILKRFYMHEVRTPDLEVQLMPVCAYVWVMSWYCGYNTGKHGKVKQ